MNRTYVNKKRISERHWVLFVAVGVMALTMLPYLIGAALAKGRHFMWLGYNLDDSCVYLSWMRQAAEGSIRAYNLFTTEPQSGMALNPLFLVMGRLSGWTGVSLLTIYHSARVLFGICLLYSVWWLATLTIADQYSRKLGILCVCFSSGLGWLPFWWEGGSLPAPIDTWQPEAITLLSLLLSPLFAFSLSLQVVILGLLYQASQKSSWRNAVVAGSCGFVLGLVHSYDVISVSAVWLVYLVTKSFRPSGTSVKTTWLLTLLSGLITAPSVIYVYLQYRNEAVFRARADVATLSAPLYQVILGYGFTLLLACVGVVFMSRKKYDLIPSEVNEQIESALSSSISHNAGEATSISVFTSEGILFLLLWAIVNIAVSYLPGLAFQRKMLQGAHIPIALLAGMGAAIIIRSRLPLPLQRSAFTLPLLLMILGLTNLRFVIRESANYAANQSHTRQHHTYLETGEFEAVEWIKRNTRPDEAVQPLPWVIALEQNGRQQRGAYDSTLACFMPGLTNRKVYCGHWGETPDYGSKLLALSRFAYPETSDTERMDLIRQMKVNYLVFSQKRQADNIDDHSSEKLAPMFREMAELPPYLVKVYSNEYADIYRILHERLP